jgi:hypothetical protein
MKRAIGLLATTSVLRGKKSVFLSRLAAKRRGTSMYLERRSNKGFPCFGVTQRGMGNDR